ncbi:TIGR03085 family protein [Rhodococcus rhodnii]|uniref:Uncharacterized protein n=2 Tax=Rhodococcus rhodnii TaxID=38312 RepID=R7WP42_9NOCA|nr:TIGR03085 family metal-binding protein [Rhodococcus rhodnii]EOM77082.1 hypothetical protein Rrhod_1549 [Rhodococcus rhodnii LMG 5362]TXG90890.1 TIGR03085 family protein [Rhodococcus rhodnii]
MTYAQDERHALVDTMRQVGPEAPTLCDGWDARDLAAHLVVRERRLDAAPGILLPPLAGHTERIRREYAEHSWEDLLGDVRSGPPVWSPFRVLDSVANVAEMFVHHEDVRRAQDDWTRRELTDEQADTLWRLARTAGMRSYRRAPVSVVLARPGGDTATVHRSRTPRTVTLTGEPSELLLHAFGRDRVDLDVSGEPDDVAAIHALDRGL